jgi:hypothetical protein
MKENASEVPPEAFSKSPDVSVLSALPHLNLTNGGISYPKCVHRRRVPGMFVIPLLRVITLTVSTLHVSVTAGVGA